MTRAPRSPRRVAAALALSLLAIVLPAGQGFGQSADETTATALLSQDGWWNRAQGPQSGEPSNPLRPVIGGVVPAPSTVPANAIAVGSVLGEPDKVAAVGIVLDAPPDALVDRLILKLKESTGEGANANAAGAKIVACPITAFWAGVKNGEFQGRPTCDEGQSVPGTRADDGTWTFDLTLVGSSWLDTTADVPQNGVLFMESVDAPASFQVSFGDISTGTMTVDFSATGGGFSGSSEFEFEQSAEPVDTATAFEDVPTDGSFSPDTSSPSFGSTSGSSDVVASPTTGAAAPTPEVAQPAAGNRAAVEPDLFGNLPLAAILFLVLLLIAGALFVALVVGPMTAPTAVPTRSGGVSRVLAAREAARS